MNATNETYTVTMNATTIDVDPPLVAHNTLLAFGIVNLTLCSIASILCVILIASLTLPLVSAKGRKEYSTYNLYLAFLSIPDLVANVFIIYITVTNTLWVDTGTTTVQDNSLWFLSYPYDDAIYEMCVTANLYTNAFLTYEMYKLLKYSSQRKRYYPPTLGTVTKQAMICYAIGLFVFAVDYWAIGNRIDDKPFVHLAFIWIVCVTIPLSVLIVVTVRIFSQGLIASTQSLYEGRLRVLTVFFLRIVLVELLVWVPSGIAFTIQWTVDDERTKVIAYHTSLLSAGTQVMINFGFALTKPDTKKWIVELPHRFSCKDWELCTKKYNGDEADDDNQTNRRFKDPFLRMRCSLGQPSSRRSTILSKSRNSSSMGRDDVELCLDDKGIRSNNVAHIREKSCDTAVCNRGGCNGIDANVLDPDETIDNSSSHQIESIL